MEQAQKRLAKSNPARNKKGAKQSVWPPPPTGPMGHHVCGLAGYGMTVQGAQMMPMGGMGANGGGPGMLQPMGGPCGGGYASPNCGHPQGMGGPGPGPGGSGGFQTPPAFGAPGSNPHAFGAAPGSNPHAFSQPHSNPHAFAKPSPHSGSSASRAPIPMNASLGGPSPRSPHPRPSVSARQRSDHEMRSGPRCEFRSNAL